VIAAGTLSACSNSNPQAIYVAFVPSSPVVAAGDSVILIATAYDNTNTPIFSVNFSWSSDNPAIASVDGQGRVTGVTSGSAYISARGGGALGQVQVIVGGPDGG